MTRTIANEPKEEGEEAAHDVLPIEACQQIAGLLDPVSLVRSQMVSRGWNKKMRIPPGRSGDAQDKQIRHKRVWASVASDEELEKTLLKEYEWYRYRYSKPVAQSDVDLVMLGSDIEYLYEADIRHKLSEEYTPSALLLLCVAGETHECRYYINRGKKKHRLLKVFKHKKFPAPTMWELGTTSTCATFFKRDTEIYHLAIKTITNYRMHCQMGRQCFYPSCSTVTLPTEPSTVVPLLGQIWDTPTLDFEYAGMLMQDISDVFRRQQAFIATKRTLDGLLDPASLVPSQTVSRAWNKEMCIPPGRSGDARDKQIRHKRLWANVASDEELEEMLLKGYEWFRGEFPKPVAKSEVDLVLLGSDIEYLYEADMRHKLSEEYTPSALLLLCVAGETHVYPYDIQRGNRHRLLKVYKETVGPAPTMWELGTTSTCTTFLKRDTKIYHLAIKISSSNWTPGGQRLYHSRSTFTLPTKPSTEVSLLGRIPFERPIRDPYFLRYKYTKLLMQDTLDVLRRQQAFIATKRNPSLKRECQ